jgi:Na+-driven multidrug efflux pump
VAAHGVGLRIQALAFVPGMSISQATGALVGNALGAGSVPRARAVLRAAVVQCTAIMSVLALLLVAGAAPLVALFDVDADTALGRYAVLWIRLLGYGMPIVGGWVALAGLFQGAGDTRTTLRINVAVTALQIPASWVLGFPLGLGALGVWLAFPVGFVLKVALAAVAYRRGRWAKTGLRA